MLGNGYADAVGMTIEHDMAVFDRLPPPVRQVVAASSNNIECEMVQFYWPILLAKHRSEEKAVDSLRDILERGTVEI